MALSLEQDWREMEVRAKEENGFEPPPRRPDTYELALGGGLSEWPLI